MTPEQRLKKAFELSETGRKLGLQGLRNRFPELTELQIQKLYAERIQRCHNRNY